MIASIPLLQSALNFFVNTISIRLGCSQIFEPLHIGTSPYNLISIYDHVLAPSRPSGNSTGQKPCTALYRTPTTCQLYPPRADMFGYNAGWNHSCVRMQNWNVGTVPKLNHNTGWAYVKWFDGRNLRSCNDAEGLFTRWDEAHIWQSLGNKHWVMGVARTHTLRSRRLLSPRLSACRSGSVMEGCRLCRSPNTTQTISQDCRYCWTLTAVRQHGLLTLLPFSAAQS